MTTRAYIFAAAAGLLGFVFGVLNGPVDFRTAGSIRSENARLRKQVEVYKKLVESYKAERREMRATPAERATSR